MNKRLKFLISLSLIFAIFVSSFMIPAASFENDVETTTGKIILVNVDTNTEVFSSEPDTKWYAGYLSELMTFIVAYEWIDDLDSVKFKVEKDYGKSLPDSDGCLNPYVGLELSAKELMGIMVISSGNDAAYALADLASGGDRAAFVAEMNKKAQMFGCADTEYVSPGYDSTSGQVTTCRDLYRLYMRLMKIDLYRELTEKKSYIPESLYIEGDDEHNELYTVYPEASIFNEKSPYYFKYVTAAKLSQTDATNSGIALTTKYHGMTYFFAGLDGLSESEKNIYADARKLVTWAYLNLSDYKLMTTERANGEVKILTGWGDYQIDLTPPQSVVKTLPNDFDELKLAYTEDIPDSVNTPVLEGQTIGRVFITYDGDQIGTARLTSTSEEGLDMLSDLGRFGSYVVKSMTPYQPVEAQEAPTQPAALPDDLLEEPAEETAAAAEG